MGGTAIIGMHRGGTSAIARIVYELGAYMGDNLLPPSEHNPLGYYEDSDLVDFHNEIIGGNWAIPKMNQSYRHIERYKIRLRKFLEQPLWAIKDPRLCFCLPLLARIVPDINVIAVYRDPFNAAKSLAKRNDMPFGIALAISRTYLRQMLNVTETEETLSVRYIDAIINPVETVQSISDFIGATITDSALSAVAPELAHWEAKDCFPVLHRGMAESG